MSTINSKNVQVGTSGVATDNFTLYQPATPDGTVRLGVGNSGATTGDVITVNSAGVTVTGTLTATTLSGSLGAATATSLTVAGNNISAVNSLGFRNRIINGDMRIDQRNAGASASLTSAQTYFLDRWFAVEDTDGTMTIQQSSTAPAGFSNSALLTTGTADASLGATQLCYFAQKPEGYNVADLAWGTASAQSITLSFWVRSSLTGTFGGAIANNAFNRSYPFTYTINAANTFEYKTVTIAGDTSGTWVTNNGVGMQIFWGLGVGSTYSGTAGAWAGSGFISATGATSVVGTNGATFYITGVQLEAGSVATPFERRDYGRELFMCQRYYEKLVWPQGTNCFNLIHNTSNTSQSIGTFSLLVPKRATPTASCSAAATFFSGNLGNAWSITSILGTSASQTNGSILLQLSSSPSVSATYAFVPTGQTAFFVAEAEL